MELLQYSPKRVSVSIAGIHTITGFVDGTFIGIRKHAEPFSISRAADGQVARVYNSDQSYTIDIILAQSSPSNDILNMLYSLDLATQKGMFPIFIKDGSGNTNFISTSTWINQPPEVSFSSDMESRIWSLHCTQGILNIGGNADQNLLMDVMSMAISAAPILDKLGLV